MPGARRRDACGPSLLRESLKSWRAVADNPVGARRGAREIGGIQMRKRADGFTLVELMVVVLIIGVLVAVAVPVFNAARDNAEWATCQANQRTIVGAIEAYNASHDTPLDVPTRTGWSITPLAFYAPKSYTPNWWRDSYYYNYEGNAPNNEFPYKGQSLIPDYMKLIPRCPAVTRLGGSAYARDLDNTYLINYRSGRYTIEGDKCYYFPVGPNGYWSPGHSSVFL